MQLNVTIEERTTPLQVEEEFLDEAETFFRKMDADMADGWQMSREWVDNPTREQRCQIVADRLLAAIEGGNEQLATMMAAYILSRMPGVEGVDIDAHGEMMQTRFQLRGG